MNGIPWTSDEIEFCKNKIDEGFHPRSFIEQLNTNYRKNRTLVSLEGVLHRKGISYVATTSKGTPSPARIDSGNFEERAAKIIYADCKDVKKLSWEQCLDGFSAAKEFRGSFSHSFRQVKCRIDTDQPIALACISDVHLGSPFCDYEAFKSDISSLIADPRLYMMKGGDWNDKMSNFFDRTAAVGQLHPEKIQLLTTERIMNAFNGRIIAAIGGNHDKFDARKTGLSSEYWIHRDQDFPYMPTGGLVTLTVGEVDYRIVWTHQYGAGNSRLNKHNVFRWLRHELDESADIYILEHHHDPSIMQHELSDFSHRSVVEIRTGSYKINDPYSQQFFKEGRPGPQMVVLDPKRKDVTPFHGKDAIQKAQFYLNGQAQAQGRPAKKAKRSKAD